MALFRKNNKEEKVGEKKVETTFAQASAAMPFYKVILKEPRVTEKATLVSERGAYVFNVHPKASKDEIAKAVTALYRVKPAKVNVVNIPAKRLDTRSSRMRKGAKSGGRKAYVYLKAGETIEIV